MNDHDVVVVGGRVAGAATAMLLARSGLRVAVVERARPGTDTVSTHAFMRAGVFQLARWGLLEEVERAGTPGVRRIVFHYPDLEPVTVTLQPRGGVDALFAPRRFMLDRILLEAAREAGAQVVHGTVTGLLRGREDRAAGVRVLGADGRDRLLRARHTVGADGIASVVARNVEAPVLRQAANASAILYRYHEALPAEGYEWVYGRGTAAGLIPTNAGQTCVFVSTTPARMRELRRAGSEAAYSTLLRRVDPALAERVADARPASRLHGWGGVRGYLRQAHGPGWALVGDAGYFKDPCTAHGMTDALRDAQLLADAIVQAASGTVCDAIALARYQSLRDRLSLRLFAATDSVAGYDWDTPTIQRLLREVSASMGDEVDHLEESAAGMAAGSIEAKV